MDESFGEDKVCGTAGVVVSKRGIFGWTKRPFGLFVRVNNHSQGTIFSGVVMSNEKIRPRIVLFFLGASS